MLSLLFLFFVLLGSNASSGVTTHQNNFSASATGASSASPDGPGGKPQCDTDPTLCDPGPGGQ